MGRPGWADPEAELAFGYVMNQMDLGLAGDLRSYSLVNACYAALIVSRGGYFFL